jgi:hypothetical protein
MLLIGYNDSQSLREGLTFVFFLLYLGSSSTLNLSQGRKMDLSLLDSSDWNSLNVRHPGLLSSLATLCNKRECEYLLNQKMTYKLNDWQERRLAELLPLHSVESFLDPFPLEH